MSYSAVPLEGKIGFGTMSLTWRPDPIPQEKSVELLKYITNDLGVTFLNGGEFYGADFANLKLLQKFVEENDDEVNKNLVISIKGAIGPTLKPSGDKAGIERSIDNIISYFPRGPNAPKVLFECARVDPNVPIEESIGYIAEYVKAGKIDGISLSEVGIESIREAQKVFPISCVELEFSIMSQEIVELGILEELAAQKIPVIAYSPLCRGFLTDHTVETADTFLDSVHPLSFLNMLDRFSRENFPHNVAISKKLYDFAHGKKNTTLESLAISWIVKLSKSSEFSGIKNLPLILPIPSASNKEKLDKNLNHLVDLTAEDLESIQKIATENKLQGYRYNKHSEALLLQ